MKKFKNNIIFITFLVISVSLCLSNCGCDGNANTNDPSDVPDVPDVSVVCEGDYEISNDDELQALKNCNTITGYLFIAFTDISDLTPLRKLRHIDAEFLLKHNDSLISLEGLNNLESVGSLYIYYNDNLKNLDGLESLVTISKVTVGDQEIAEVAIYENSDLPDCYVENFAKNLLNFADLDLYYHSNNDDNCPDD